MVFRSASMRSADLEMPFSSGRHTEAWFTFTNRPSPGTLEARVLATRNRVCVRGRRGRHAGGSRRRSRITPTQRAVVRAKGQAVWQS